MVGDEPGRGVLVAEWGLTREKSRKASELELEVSESSSSSLEEEDI